MALRKSYKCLDHLMVAVAALREGDLEVAEKNLADAIEDPEIEDALEDLDSENAEDEDAEDEDTPGTAEKSDPEAEEEKASLDPQERIRRNLASL